MELSFALDVDQEKIKEDINELFSDVLDKPEDES